jgi:hypothetical protein
MVPIDLMYRKPQALRFARECQLPLRTSKRMLHKAEEWNLIGYSLPSAAGGSADRHPWEGAVQQLGVAVGLPPKTGGLWDSGSYTATLVSAR